MATNARQRELNLPLTESAVQSTLRSILPRANDYCPVNYAELIAELKLFGISNRRQLRQLILRHFREAIRIDREPVDTTNAKIQRNELGTEKYLYLERRRIFFGWEGLVRVILELEFGDRYRAFSEKRDHGAKVESVVV